MILNRLFLSIIKHIRLLSVSKNNNVPDKTPHPEYQLVVELSRVVATCNLMAHFRYSPALYYITIKL